MKFIDCNYANRMEASAKPTARVESGEVFKVQTINAYGDRFETKADLLDLLKNKKGKHHHHPLTGPIEIKGAEVGDIIRVDIGCIEVQEMAQTLSRSAGVEPIQSKAFGSRSAVIGSQKGNTVHFIEGIFTALRPMIGIIGTAPREGYIKTGHATETGGNLDIPFVATGASVYLPVEVSGGQLYLGDAHAIQGYGELSGIAMEASAVTMMRVVVCKTQKGWFEEDPFLEVQREMPPIVIAGKEPLSGKVSFGIIGVSKDFDDTRQAITSSFSSATLFMRQIHPTLSWGMIRSLTGLIGHSLNGQAGSKTAEPTAMVLIPSEDICFSATGDHFSEIKQKLFPEKG